MLPGFDEGSGGHGALAGARGVGWGAEARPATAGEHSTAAGERRGRMMPREELLPTDYVLGPDGVQRKLSLDSLPFRWVWGGRRDGRGRRGAGRRVGALAQHAV